MPNYCPKCGLDISIGPCGCDNLSIFHIRRHVAGFTLRDQPVYKYSCSEQVETERTAINGDIHARCGLCYATLRDEILCDHESCEHHSTVSFYVAIVDMASGSEIGELCESENLHAAEKKVNDLNALDADPDTRFRIGQRGGQETTGAGRR